VNIELNDICHVVGIMRNARKVRIDCVLWNTDARILVDLKEWVFVYKEPPTCAKEERW
jgi:hypothetical protein